MACQKQILIQLYLCYPSRNRSKMRSIIKSRNQFMSFWLIQNNKHQENSGYLQRIRLSGLFSKRNPDRMNILQRSDRERGQILDQKLYNFAQKIVILLMSKGCKTFDIICLIKDCRQSLIVLDDYLFENLF